MLEVHSFVNSPVTSNCYVLFNKTVSHECIIVDPGSKDEKELFDYLEEEGLVPRFIILTHEHFDHCWGVNQLVEKYSLPIVCSELCADAIKYEKRNCSVFYDNREAFSIYQRTISIESLDNELWFGVFRIRFYKTPGHTDASISFVADMYLFTGDSLIKDEKTVTKLPAGSVKGLDESIALYEDLKEKGLFVCPGHGEQFELDGYDLQIMAQGIK